MLIQAIQGVEFPIAKIALVAMSIPRSSRSQCLPTITSRHGNHRSRNDISMIESADQFVDFLASETGGTGA